MAEIKMLAIDLGASSGRGIIGKFDGEKLTLNENHRFASEPVTIAGSFNWDIMRIFHEIKQAINKCALSEDKDIKGIGIDTWGVDYGFLDKKGKLLTNPVHYRDARTVGIQEEAFRVMPPEKLYGVTGIQFMDFNTVFQLIAELRDNPELVAAADKMLFIPDLLNYFLTGVKRTEYSIASTGALLDAKTRNWAWDVIDAYNIPRRLFTDISMPGSTVGPLLPSLCEELGDIRANVINVAAHDTASAVVAVPAKGNDFVYISSGTWSLMGTEIPEPIVNESSLKYNFTNEGGFGGTIRFLKNIMGLWIEQESRRQWIREGEKYSYDELSDMAMASKPLQSLINPDDPAFVAPGNIPKRICEYCEKTGQHVPENKGEIVRAIFDSLALRYRWAVEAIDDMKGKRTPFINIVGGGCKEEPLCRLCADSCNRPVYAGPVEGTAIGNLLVQLIALGEIKDLAEARQIIRNSFEIKEYQPSGNTEMWDEAYERFLKLIK
ncbi:MAG: rhamnulokinase [Clostridia bacterium]|nr:rhamnulokinase [Clostridia bacterium]